MSEFLVIESRDPYDFNFDAFLDEFYSTAKSNAKKVSVFFVQNGVLPLRKGAKYSENITKLIDKGIEVLADDFSLNERGIQETVAGAKISNI